MSRDPFYPPQLEREDKLENDAEDYSETMANRFFRFRHNKRHFYWVKSIYRERALSTPRIMYAESDDVEADS